MKYIKAFEKVEFQTPQVGDYVLVHELLNTEYKEFINNTIGKVELIHAFEIGIKYENIPDDISEYFNNTVTPDMMLIHKMYIVDFAKTEEELNIKLAAKKYNL